MSKYIIILAILFTACKSTFENKAPKNKKESSKKIVKSANPKNKKNDQSKWISIIRPDYTLKYPKVCKIDNKINGNVEFVITAPSKQSKIPTTLTLRKLPLKTEVDKMINQHISSDKKQIRGFKLLGKFEDGYVYTMYRKGNKVKVHHKMKTNENFAYVFTYQCLEKNYNNYVNVVLNVFKSFQFKI